MRLDELKDKVSQAVLKAELIDAVNLLLCWLKDDFYLQEARSLSSRYHQNERDWKSFSNIPAENYHTETGRIRTGIEGLVSRLNESDVSPHPRRVFEILVIPKPEDADGISVTTHLEKFGLTGVEVQHRVTFDPEDRRFQLILFDNVFMGKIESDFDASRDKCVESRMNLMKDYLSARKDGRLPDTYFIYYGSECFLVSNNREYFHAANSIFSLYARVVEMLEFIKIYRYDPKTGEP